MRCRMLCPSSLVAALLLLAAVAAESTPNEPLSLSAAPPTTAPRARDEVCRDQAIDPRLIGLWHRHDAVADGDPLAFYYFHERGFGIYRYGRVGLTNTHSFDFSGHGGALDLRFRKTGTAHAPRYRVEDDADGTWLVLRGDPREAGEEVRYRRAPDPTAACASGPLDLHAAPGIAGGPLGGRLWGEEQRYATGGMGFAIYQLQQQAIDGRGVGWYHRGDYDEWLTETLTYRQQGDQISLGFTLRHESQQTAITLGEAADGARTLTLAADPRDFWRAHTYRDMGPSFASTCL